MDLKLTLMEILDTLHDEAASEFRRTELHAACMAPIDEMCIPSEEDERFKAYQLFYFEEGKFLYRKGMRDCISILKELEALSLS